MPDQTEIGKLFSSGMGTSASSYKEPGVRQIKTLRAGPNSQRDINRRKDQASNSALRNTLTNTYSLEKPTFRPAVKVVDQSTLPTYVNSNWETKNIDKPKLVSEKRTYPFK